MGEGKRRKHEVHMLADLAVGPGPLHVTGTSVIIIGRTDANSMARVVEAVRLLVHKDRLADMIAAWDKPSMKGAEWVIVDSIHDGPSGVNLVRPGHSTLNMAFDRVADGFSERELDWTTLVIASEFDRDEVRKMIQPFAQRHERRRRTPPAPKLAISREREPKVILEISRQEVEASDLRNTLMGLDVMVVDRRFLDKAGNRLVLAISGYDDDPRHLGEIEDVRNYLGNVSHHAPWAPLLSHKSMYMLWCAALDERCVVTKTAENGMSNMHVPPQSSKQIMDWLGYTAAMVNANNLCQEDIHPAIQSALMTWRAFMIDGSDANEAIEEGLAFGIPPEIVRQWAEPPKEPPRNLPSDKAVDSPSGGGQAGAAEKAFWERTVETASPGWVAELSVDQIGKGLTRQEFVIYVLDTATGISFAAGFPEAEAINVMTKTRESNMQDEVITLAISTIRRLGQAKLTDPASQDARVAIVASVGALGATSLVNAVKAQQGSLKGQWIYMVYQPKHGEPTARSTFALTASKAIAPLLELFQICADVIKSDLAKPGNVNSYISKGGGLSLCGTLQRLVDEA